MKKVILTIAAIATMATSGAFAQLQFGAKVGGNLSNLAGKDAKDLDSKLGFNVGATVDYGFTDQWFVFSGLEVTQKGYKFDMGTEVTASPLYLQLPIHVAYKYELGSVKLVPEVGPYVAFGIAGKVKGDSGDGIDYFGDKEDQFGAKSFDFGIGAGLGVEFLEHFAVKIGYDYGLAEIVKDVKATNTNLYLSLGYKF